jgi:hypothetical protein
MEGFDKTKYDEILGLPAMGLHAAVICPVGMRGDDKYAAAPKFASHKKSFRYR